MFFSLLELPLPVIWGAHNLDSGFPFLFALSPRVANKQAAMGMSVAGPGAGISALQVAVRIVSLRLNWAT